MINWQHYRSLFPVVSNKIYFMTAGAGAIPLPVLNAIKSRYDEVSNRGGEVFGENLRVLESCREKLAQLINTDKKNIAFIPNVSYGMNVLAHSVKKEELFFTLDDEFPSTTLPIKNSNRKIKEIECLSDKQTGIIKFLESSQASTSSLAISAVSYVDGYRLDLNELSKYKKSARFLINGTQAIGAFPVDVKKQKVDALVCSCYKWMCCGEGISFMYIEPEFFKCLNPAFVGWRSARGSMSFKSNQQNYFEDARIFEIGWDNMTIFSGFSEALSLINSIGVENISSRIINLSTKLLNLLKEFDIPFVSDTAAKHISGIVSIGPFKNSEEIAAKLEKNNIWTNPRRDFIRISLHFYNNYEDIYKLVDVLKKILNVNEFLAEKIN